MAEKGRHTHTFQFEAAAIAEAAGKEADWHEERLRHWRDQYDTAVAVVEKTIGAKVVRREVTGGYMVDVAIDYGDKAAWAQCQRAAHKIQRHRDAAERYRNDQRLYATQPGARVYDLTVDDVQYYRIGMEERKNGVEPVDLIDQQYEKEVT